MEPHVLATYHMCYHSSGGVSGPGACQRARALAGVTERAKQVFLVQRDVPLSLTVRSAELP